MTNKIPPEISKMGREKRTKNADEFATETYKIVTELKTEEKITSFHDTAKMLNRREVPTYSGGEWRVNTLQNLYKRCKKLGILD